MKFCLSPLAPMLALVGIEAAIVTALVVWLVLSWLGLAAVGPLPEIIMAAIVATGVIMALLPLARMAASRDSLLCNENAGEAGQ
ncbi:hypothetical protein [Aquisalinus flavus]|uniref:Uncharacterized protein n=1 Tax=Aquisalinus flavus TaxID=1526572 RepID=A0A8J2Y2X3_9PROT|nr:hypothetical protein [Aquisalinus flavus]MBD0426790.1 hypothetical protein [Aquisalinus flavus]UNE46641.1 hypothetical protein FF099_00495 [Aquisalinus flavus]GGC96028.1 hypothetical protein GCM10011342_01010 [Aquisalinus flavus]